MKFCCEKNGQVAYAYLYEKCLLFYAHAQEGFIPHENLISWNRGEILEKWMVEMLKIHGSGLGCVEAWDPACLVGFPLWVRGSEIIYDF